MNAWEATAAGSPCFRAFRPSLSLRGCAPADQVCASHAESCRARTRTRPGGATHGLRDGDEAGADERQGAAGVAAGPGEGRQSDQSRGSEARHAHAWPRAPAA